MANKPENGSWKRMSFKGNKVWVQTNEDESLVVSDGKVLIKYNLKQDYEYRVHAESLQPEDQAVPAVKKEKSAGSKKTKKASAPVQADPGVPTEEDIPENCIRIYTDGASSGNPGPSGIGALFLFKENRKEISRYIGQGTNNIAELTAILVALETLKRNDIPVRIFTDSSYAIGLLTQGWKPRTNQDLVKKIRILMGRFKDLAFIKVKGHAGIKENEVADYLATSAIKKGPE